jgi:hypothetical protein
MGKKEFLQVISKRTLKEWPTEGEYIPGPNLGKKRVRKTNPLFPFFKTAHLSFSHQKKN